ncbi:hypothetical protein BJ742DRAFT_785056 [Cladochytrium replicatum]|nr:hypothetical protein BJ742DRAFT_785056 [Cladochytrium replicatum]
MYGLIHVAIENFVLENFGRDAWDKIKQTAGCRVNTGGFMRLHYHPDAETIALVAAGASLLGVSVDVVLEKFGAFFADFVLSEGYGKLLTAIGNNLEDFMSGLNLLHEHLHRAYPKMLAPSFYCTEDVDFIDETGSGDSAFILTYVSARQGLGALVVGLVKQIALKLFDQDVEFNLLETGSFSESNLDGSETIWRVRILSRGDIKAAPTFAISHVDAPSTDMIAKALPVHITGRQLSIQSGDHFDPNRSLGLMVRMPRQASCLPLQMDGGSKVPSFVALNIQVPTNVGLISGERPTNSHHSVKTTNRTGNLANSHPSIASQNGNDQITWLSRRDLQKLFPFHVIIDSSLNILDVGYRLARMFPGMLRGADDPSNPCLISEFFTIIRPAKAAFLPSVSGLNRIARSGQVRVQSNVLGFRKQHLSNDNSSLQKVELSGQLVKCHGGDFYFFLCSPAASTIDLLVSQGLALADIPPWDRSKELILISEHRQVEMGHAHNVEKENRRLVESERKTIVNEATEGFLHSLKWQLFVTLMFSVYDWIDVILNLLSIKDLGNQIGTTADVFIVYTTFSIVAAAGTLYDIVIFASEVRHTIGILHTKKIPIKLKGFGGDQNDSPSGTLTREEGADAEKLSKLRSAMSAQRNNFIFALVGLPFLIIQIYVILALDLSQGSQLVYVTLSMLTSCITFGIKIRDAEAMVQSWRNYMELKGTIALQAMEKRILKSQGVKKAMTGLAEASAMIQKGQEMMGTLQRGRRGSYAPPPKPIG